MRISALASSALALTITLAACTDTASETTEAQTAAEAANVASAPPIVADPGDRVVLFGDLHLHTSYSLDAAAAKTNTTPDDAYRYAKGEQINYLGNMIQRKAPLDFLAVTDHAEFLGNLREAEAGDRKLPGDQSEWQRLFSHQGGAVMFELFNKVVAGIFGEDIPGLADPAGVYNHWQEEIAAAESNYEPGKFTSFVAFEYSPTYRSNDAHMHRNVIFRGPNYPEMPFGATDSMHHEALWAYAENLRLRGIQSLMIPHNSNLSDGLTFGYNDTYGNPMSADYARSRAKWEPLVEITQIKGTSETRPELSPDDEFAGFELLPADGDVPGAYVRTGLQRGMEISERLGVNPFEQGFVGATDYHSGASSTEEDNFPGGLGLSDDHSNALEILTQDSPILGAPLAGLSAGGLTGVWADENTREAIFDAFMRRETFATSGPRIQVRMFGGWNDAAALGQGANWAQGAYRWGVPMGGTLSPPPAGTKGPSFVVQAARDPNSGNLDRVQIVKLWRDGGKSYEKIYNVAWSDGRKMMPNGKLPPVGNTVDASKATYSNTIGSTELFGTWSDPDFDPNEQAIYYARVIEIPTPRWATYLSVKTGIPLKDTLSAWLQERAWTSPVYYKP